MASSTPRRETSIKPEPASLSNSDDLVKVSSLHLSRSSDSPSYASAIKSSNSTPRTPDVKQEKIAADVSVKMESGKPPKLARLASHKIQSRPPQLFGHEPDKYEEATSLFQVINDCIYSNKHIGSTEPALEFDCQEEWDTSIQKNNACGEDSDCINRATKMECLGDCSCGAACQNQRFQRKEFADVVVFKTEKKGYGLRAESNLSPNQFIFEYIGEVINEPNFRRRMRQYDDEGIKHFYFMSLNKGEFIDATKRGNLGRFCNHSCNPNCYVDKWVVEDKLRMGIFAQRAIQVGEELVFNYNVDRYGADPQPCYCGEPNCTGFIGGKTQTERGTKLSNATIEALGIDDLDDWDIAVPKKAKKARRTGEDDEEYVNTVQPRSLEEDGVIKVMPALMQCKEKWIAVKLLTRIQRAEGEHVLSRVVRMHGYRILKAALTNFADDANVCLQVLDVLLKLPRITRNKIQDSGIEETVSNLKQSDDTRVVEQAANLLQIWAKLEVAYRIPRVKRDPNSIHMRIERREGRERSRSRSRSKSPIAPTGPKNKNPQRATFTGSRPPFRPRPFAPLPQGWFQASSAGRVYYYSASGETQWTRPTAPPPSTATPPKQISHEERLQQIINNITKSNNTPKDSPGTTTPQAIKSVIDEDEEKVEKWHSYSEAKQKKIYENTLFPHIKHVLDKYKNKLPREDIKRFGKEISKKLVNSDFKNDRVANPYKISSKQAHSVKKYVKDFFDKAVHKHREHEKRRQEKELKQRAALSDQDSASQRPTTTISANANGNAVEEEVQLTDEEHSDNEASLNDSELKRKRENGEEKNTDEDWVNKKAKVSEIQENAPPPPPPPPIDIDESQGLLDGDNTILQTQEQATVS